MIKALIFAIAVVVICFPAYAAEDKTGQDNFVSNAITDAFTKVNQYMTGQKEIVTDSDDAIGMKEGMEYGSDPLGNRIQRPVKSSVQAPGRGQRF
jgi:hypothetical protein